MLMPHFFCFVRRQKFFLGRADVVQSIYTHKISCTIDHTPCMQPHTFSWITSERHPNNRHLASGDKQPHKARFTLTNNSAADVSSSSSTYKTRNSNSEQQEQQQRAQRSNSSPDLTASSSSTQSPPSIASSSPPQFIVCIVQTTIDCWLGRASHKNNRGLSRAAIEIKNCNFVSYVKTITCWLYKLYYEIYKKQLIYTWTIILIRIDDYILHQITYKKYYRNVFELINLISLHLADEVP